MNLKMLCRVSIVKTIYINFRCLPVKQAIKLPIIIGKHTEILIKGKINIHSHITMEMIGFGLGGSPDLYHYNSKRNYLRIGDGAKIVFMGSANFASHTSCLVAHSEIVFGDGFRCNNGCRFSSVEGIEFGKACLLGGNIVIRDSDGHTIYDIDSNGNRVKKHTNKAKIKIGNHVWIANDSAILKGVTIPDDSVIGYRSMVTRSIEKKYSIIAGSPAKVVKEHIEWER